jgi:hypothetical protein
MLYFSLCLPLSPPPTPYIQVDTEELIFFGDYLWAIDDYRNVIIGVALFRRAGVRCRVSDDSVSLVDGADVISHTSLDSASSHQETANVESVSHDHNKFG